MVGKDVNQDIVLPKVIILSENESFLAYHGALLEAFPSITLSMDSFESETVKFVEHVFLVDFRVFNRFFSRIEHFETEALILAHSICLSPDALVPEETTRLYNLGVFFVSDKDTAHQVLKGRLETLFSQKSRLLSCQILNQRMKLRLDSQRRHLDYQNEFLQMAVHDLRSPLSAMICYAELLMEGVLGNLEATQLEPIRTIHRNCQFLIDMVTDLLDSARIGAGKLQLKLEKVNFLKEVEMAVQSLRGLADTKSISISLQFDFAPELYVDIQKVSRVLSNLLGNAIKFTKVGGKINIRSSRQGNVLVFSIQDTGPGIAPADLESIFEKFQVGSGSNVSGKGHGLGLAISKSFVELHGGKLFVESTRHKGSIFIIHMPIEKRKPRSPQIARKRIIILDLAQDMPDLASVGEEGKVGGFQVEYFPLQVHAWDKVSILPSDFVLINEKPVFDSLGLDFYLLALSELTSESRCAVLVNSQMNREYKETRRILGLNILEKPCTLKELFDKLQLIIGVDRRQRNN